MKNSLISVNYNIHDTCAEMCVDFSDHSKEEWVRQTGAVPGAVRQALLPATARTDTIQPSQETGPLPTPSLRVTLDRHGRAM